MPDCLDRHPQEKPQPSGPGAPVPAIQLGGVRLKAFTGVARDYLPVLRPGSAHLYVRSQRRFQPELEPAAIPQRTGECACAPLEGGQAGPLGECPTSVGSSLLDNFDNNLGCGPRLGGDAARGRSVAGATSHFGADSGERPLEAGSPKRGVKASTAARQFRATFRDQAKAYLQEYPLDHPVGTHDSDDHGAGHDDILAVAFRVLDPGRGGQRSGDHGHLPELHAHVEPE